MIKLATPTPNTRAVAHFAVGAATTVTMKKLVGTSGFLVLLAGFAVSIIVHEMLDAPLAQAMASMGLQF